VSHLGPSLRRKRRAARAWPRVAAAIAASLALNAALVAVVRMGVVRPPAAVTRSVAVTSLSAKDWEANRAVRDGAPAPAPQPPATAAIPPPPKPPEPEERPGQVVDVAPSKDSTPPKDSRFVSERNNTVEKETISRDRKSGHATTQPVPTEKPSAATPPPAGSRGAGGTSNRSTPGVAKREPPPARAGEGTSGERLALKLDRFGDHLPKRTPGAASQEPAAEQKAGDPRAGDDAGTGTSPGKTIDRSKLHPSASTYEKLVGGPAPDHVTGVEEGEGTFLNTREWKYASYFNRIKQAVANSWEPGRAIQRRDPDGTRFGGRDRDTVLAVRLDESGSLKDVAVVKSSGLEFLDDVAVEAFRKAQPFANPPRGLADPRGEIAFTFSFFIQNDGGFRMFRRAGP
jgi:TonB family protein